MRRLIYRSLNLTGGNFAAMINIVRVSIRNNTARDVTGMLYFDREIFVQYLEGPDAALEELRRALARDGRHMIQRMEELSPAPARRFPDVPMAFYDGDQPHPAPGATALRRLPRDAPVAAAFEHVARLPYRAPEA